MSFFYICKLCSFVLLLMLETLGFYNLEDHALYTWTIFLYFITYLSHIGSHALKLQVYYPFLVISIYLSFLQFYRHFHNFIFQILQLKKNNQFLLYIWFPKSLSCSLFIPFFYDYLLIYWWISSWNISVIFLKVSTLSCLSIFYR